MLRALSILALAVAAVFAAQAADPPAAVRLFDGPGVAVRDYDTRAEAIFKLLKAGSGPVVVEFSGGRRFALSGYLGGEGLNYIFETADGFALRIARVQSMAHTITSYAAGYPMLVDDGIPVVTTHLDRSDPAEFILMENDPREFTYSEYLRIRHQLPEARRRVIDAEFVKFAVASWKYKAFGDQTQTQLAFTRSGKWKLYDWTNKHARAAHIGDGTIFTADFMEAYVTAGKVKEGKMVDSDAREKLPLPSDLAKSILAAIREKRAAEGMQLGPIDQLFDCAKRGILRWLGLGRATDGG